MAIRSEGLADDSGYQHEDDIYDGRPASRRAYGRRHSRRHRLELVSSGKILWRSDRKDWQTTVVTNTKTTFTTVDPLPAGLTAGDTVVVTDSSWCLAGRSYGDQITLGAPNRAGLTIQIVGRSSTANGMEAPIEQSFPDRYTMIGGTGSQIGRAHV